MTRLSATIEIVMQSEPLAVRDGLRRLFAASPLCDLSPDAQGTVQIVLAEALNNIVEHAYRGSKGCIAVRLRHLSPDLLCEIVDGGQPMPDSTLPAGILNGLTPDDDLPEGGFGWFMIRALAQDLAYCRDPGRNLLCFRLQVA